MTAILVPMTGEHSFCFLDVADAKSRQSDLDWIGADLGKDVDLDAFLGFKAGSDDLPVFATLSGEPLGDPEGTLPADNALDTPF